MPDVLANYYDVVRRVLDQAAVVLINEELGLIVVRPKTDGETAHTPEEILEIQKNEVLIEQIWKLSLGHLDSKSFGALLTELLTMYESGRNADDQEISITTVISRVWRLSEGRLDIKSFGLLMVDLLNQYDPRMNARLTGTTIELYDRYEKVSIDLNLIEV